MSTKFTSGPWKKSPGFKGEHGFDCIEIMGEHGVGGCAIWLAKVQTVTPRKSWDDLTEPPWATEKLKAECEANADLILAAPDMYDVLEACEVDLSTAVNGLPASFCDRDDYKACLALLEKIRAALAKARGETP